MVGGLFISNRDDVEADLFQIPEGRRVVVGPSGNHRNRGRGQGEAIQRRGLGGTLCDFTHVFELDLTVTRRDFQLLPRDLLADAVVVHGSGEHAESHIGPVFRGQGIRSVAAQDELFLSKQHDAAIG